RGRAGAVGGLLAARARAVDEHRGGRAGRDRGRREHEDRRRAAAAPGARREPAELGVAERGEQVLLVGRLHVVAYRAVDVARREAGIGTGGEDRLERHVVLGAAEGLPERSLPDADDRRPVADRRRVHVSTPAPARGPTSARERPRTRVSTASVSAPRRGAGAGGASG